MLILIALLALAAAILLPILFAVVMDTGPPFVEAQSTPLQHDDQYEDRLIRSLRQAGWRQATTVREYEHDGRHLGLGSGAMPT